MSILMLEGVAKKIGSRMIVDDLNMTVQPGEVYGFLGPNGAGKTTTIRMIVGLIRATKGTILVGGYDIRKHRTKALAQVGTIVENPETYGYLTGTQNLIHYARLAGIKRRDARIREVVEIVGLNNRIDDKVRRYSLGMRQRLGVAQALLARPKLLVLDEPTNGLDPAGMREFRELMRKLAGEGMSVFVSSHLLSELEMICDRVAILKAGRMITEKRMSELINNSVSGMRIHVSSAVTAEKVLRGAGYVAMTLDGHRISMPVDMTSMPSIVRVLVSSNIDIYTIEPMKDSLEDRFLDLTGGVPSATRPAGIDGSTNTSGSQEVGMGGGTYA